MIQGIGNAGLIANMISMMNKIWQPSKRAMWLSTIGVTQGIAAIVVPTLAGLLIDHWGWQSVYYVMMVIQAVGLISMMIFTPKDTTQRNYEEKPFDLKGTLLFVVWVCCIVLACNFGNAWGWTSPAIIALLAIGLVGLVVFVVVEYKMGSNAIFPVKLFADNRNCTMIFLQSFFACAVCMGQFVFVIYYMQVVMGLSAAVSAIPFTIFSIGTLVMPTVYGYIYKKTGKVQSIADYNNVISMCELFYVWIIPDTDHQPGTDLFYFCCGWSGTCFLCHSLLQCSRRISAEEPYR